MQDVLDKLSSYNLFNYLVPGTIFAVFAEYITQLKFIYDELVVAAFIFYFIGLIVSRIGSLVVQPILQKIGIIQFADYGDYIEASKKDPQIEVLSESNNSYRTYCSLFLCLLLLKLCELLADQWHFFKDATPYFTVIGLLLLFIFSYKKQTDFVVKRIKKS